MSLGTCPTLAGRAAAGQATLLFALRFFAARAAAVGACIGVPGHLIHVILGRYPSGVWAVA